LSRSSLASVYNETKSKKEEKEAHLLMLLTSMFWGASFVAGKIALLEFPPMTLTFFRFFIATIIIFPYMWSKSRIKNPERKDIPYLFAIGFLAIPIQFALQFTALQYTSPANASTIAALNPFVSSIMATYLTDERLSRRKVSLLILALCGVLLTVTGGDPYVLLSMQFNKGDLLATLGMLTFALYGIFSIRATKKYGPLLVTSYVFLFGLVQITPFMLREGVWTKVLSFSLEAWIAVIFLAIGASVLGYQFQQISIQRLGVNRTSIYINLVPPFAIIFAYVILGDKITLINIVSSSIIGIAVYLNTGGSR